MIAGTTIGISSWQARSADYAAPADYRYDGDWADANLPSEYPSGKTVFYRTSVELAPADKGQERYLTFDFQNMEGLLRVNGEAFAGIDENHRRIPAPNSDRFAIEIEFFVTPGLDGLYQGRNTSSLKGTFFGASVEQGDPELEAFYFDAWFAFETVKAISDRRRKQLLDEALGSALLAIDLTVPRERLLKDAAAARQLLAEKVAAIAPDPESGSIYAVGHTHIDTAWLWPIKETVRKCGRSFSTACRLMERDPDFHFACSQPQLYEYTKQYFPDVYAQIKKWVAAGQWETTGAMWVEADCNITSGESLIRQILHGIEFFKREFGTRPRVCWLPDVFGYPASLPEILTGCDIPYFYTYKLHMLATNPFRDHLFRWRGLDGSEVLAAVIDTPGAYNGRPKPWDLREAWERYAQKGEYPEVLFPYGFGDGGGGATIEMIESRRRAEPHYPGLPAVRTGSAEGFFDALARQNPDLPRWDGELYLEMHQGTYTSQSATKKANRANELLLRDAEIWGSLAQIGGGKYDAASIHGAWQTVLLQQFHDILPGSSIAPVYVDALTDHAAVRAAVEPHLAGSLNRLAPQGDRANSIRLFNSLSWARRDPVAFDLPQGCTDATALVASDGRTFPIQRLAGTSAIADGVDVPSIGYADFTLAKTPLNDLSPITATPEQIETPRYVISLTPEGALSSIFDKTNSREIIAEGALGNDLQLLQDGPEHEDAWNVHAPLDGRRYGFEGETSVTVNEVGPVRAVVHVVRHHRSTTIEQDIIAYAHSDRIDFVTRVNWNERQTMLKVAFPLAIRTTTAAYEVQFGAVERPTHQNTSWDRMKFEVAAQRWADLSETGYGVSLANDCRYGYDARDNVLRLTLLRGTSFPDPDADRGVHELTYSLIPHSGGWAQGETVRRAWELNVPMRVQPVSGSAAPCSFVSLSGTDAVVETIKPAEDGRGYILRIYEPHGARGPVKVQLGGSFDSVTECNLIEEDRQQVPVQASGWDFAILPFQIRTFRVLGLKLG